MSELTSPDITIFIRARNEASLIGECLSAIYSQETKYTHEVVLLDCESSDRTVEIASGHPVRIYSIPPRLFTYSSALNFGVKLARGKFFVPLSAHVVPCDNRWLDKLVEPVASAEVAASFSRQIAWPSAPPQEQESMARGYPEVDKFFSRETFLGRVGAGSSPYSEIAYSNASSCILLEVFENISFLELPFSEDRAFALELLKNDLSYKYCSGSVCYHSHPPTFREYRWVAKAATLSRDYLEKRVERDFSLSFPLSAQGLPVLLFKVLLLSGWGGLSYVLSRGGLISKESGDFYLASIGTSLGKLEAAMSEPLVHIERASTEAIEREVKELS